jgi:hypothetical protein
MSYKAQMNGGGESSGGIVPTKRQNEDQGRSKEAVEGRPLAKENMGKPNSCRTPSRESGLNGLDRVRQAAVRLTLLSEVGTVCVRSASTGLCGGCRVTGIPTATRVPTPRDALPKSQFYGLGPAHRGLIVLIEFG